MSRAHAAGANVDGAAVGRAFGHSLRARGQGNLVAHQGNGAAVALGAFAIGSHFARLVDVGRHKMHHAATGDGTGGGNHACVVDGGGHKAPCSTGRHHNQAALHLHHALVVNQAFEGGLIHLDAHELVTPKIQCDFFTRGHGDGVVGSFFGEQITFVANFRCKQCDVTIAGVGSDGALVDDGTFGIARIGALAFHEIFV